MCRVQHLLQQGRKYDIPEDDLRIAGGSLGVVGVTESGDRYIALPSHAQQLEHWAKDCATVVDYHRNKDELDQVGNAIRSMTTYQICS